MLCFNYLFNVKCRGEWDLLVVFGYESKSGFGFFFLVVLNKVMSKVLLLESISYELDK